MYQLLTDNWVFTEYNLAGMVLKKTNFSKIFENWLVLCVDEKCPRYLVTPIGAGYLNKFRILELTNEHEIVERLAFEASEINVNVLDTSVQFNMNQYILNLKNKQNTTLEFQININNQIAIGAHGNDKTILDVIFVSQMDAPLSDDNQPTETPRVLHARCVRAQIQKEVLE